MKLWYLLTIAVSFLAVGSYRPSTPKSPQTTKPTAESRAEQALQSSDGARWRQAQTSHWRYVMLKN